MQVPGCEVRAAPLHRSSVELDGQPSSSAGVSLGEAGGAHGPSTHWMELYNNNELVELVVTTSGTSITTPVM